MVHVRQEFGLQPVQMLQLFVGDPELAVALEQAVVDGPVLEGDPRDPERRLENLQVEGTVIRSVGPGAQNDHPHRRAVCPDGRQDREPCLPDPSRRRRLERRLQARALDGGRGAPDGREPLRRAQVGHLLREPGR